MTWEVLRGFEKYEISTDYPHEVRNRKSLKNISTHPDRDGYLILHLSLGARKTSARLHRLIALQWITNPENFPVIDHINGIRTDNRIENLRWCDERTNQVNKNIQHGVSYSFVSELPDHAFAIDEFNGWTFEGYYYHDGVFYRHVAINKYRMLHVKVDVSGGEWVHMTDTQGKNRSCSTARFAREYELN